MGDNLIQVNWDTHKQILFGNLSTLRDQQIHTDVTLSCEGNFYPAHKLVLTMCSGYFAEAFQYAGNSSAIFFLCGIKKETLESLLAFIYNGTVTIPSDEVEDMAKAGNILQIQELSQIASVISSKDGFHFSNDDVTIQQNGATPIKSEPMVLLEKGIVDALIKRRSDTPESKSTDDEEVDSRSDSKQSADMTKDENNPFELSRDGSSSDYEFEGWDAASIKQPKDKVRSLLSVISEKRNILKKKTCFKCKTHFDLQSELVEHFTSHHKNLMKKHYCKRCKKIFRFKKSFLKHKQVLNCGRKFCRKCSYSSLSFDDFRTHLQSHRKQSQLEGKPVNGVDSVDSKVVLMENFGDPYKRKRKFSNKALNDALRAISTDLEKFTDVGTSDFGYDDQYDMEEELSSSDSSPPKKMVKKSFSCLCCGLTFDNLHHFNSHKQAECKLLECPFCLKVFIKEKKDMLETHKRNHDLATKPYSCPYCSFASDDQQLRDHHLEEHTRKD